MLFFSLPSSYGYRPWPAFFQTNNSTVLALHLVKETGYPKGWVKALGRPLMRPVGRCWRTHSLSKEYQVTLSNFHGLQLTDQISHWYTYYYVCMKKVGMCVYIAIDWIFQYHTKKAPHSRSNYSKDPTSYLAEKSFYVERQKSSFDCMHQWTDFAGFLQNFFYSVVVVDYSQI